MDAFDTTGNTWVNPPHIMKTVDAKVIAATTINNEKAKVGSIVTVDEHTFRNLAQKGRLEAVQVKQPEPEPAEKKGDGAK